MGEHATTAATRAPDAARRTPGSAAPGAGVPTAPEQRQGHSLPASSAAPPAAASSAPVSASALVQFKVTSHGDDGYRAAVTITDTRPRRPTARHLTFRVTGSTLDQPTDTGERVAVGGVVTRHPAGRRIDGAPCHLRYVPG